MLRKTTLFGVVLNLFRSSRRNLVLASANRNSSSKKDIPEGDISKLLDDAASFSDAKNSDWVTLPYPATAVTGQEEPETKPTIEPTETSILLFPGQGTLKVGKICEYMRYPRVKEMFEIANEALGFDIKDICERGPQTVLNRTENNQPATILTSLAAAEKLQDDRPRAVDTCVAVAGFSVGEITALIFTGAISFEAAIRLVGVRGAAMQSASDSSPQGMLSVYCAPSAQLAQLCKDAENWAMNVGVAEPLCRVGIYLYTQCKILSGSEEALKYIEKHGPKMGLCRIKRIPGSGAFHTNLMQPAVHPFKEALRTITIKKPVVPVYSNFDAKAYSDPNSIARGLIKQVISPVKWEQILHKLYERPPGHAFPRTFDMGSSGAMKSILRQVNAKAWSSSYII